MEHLNKVTPEYLQALRDPVIQPMIKIELMDSEEYIFGEITQNISRDTAGSISINYQQGVRRSCNFTLIDIGEEYFPNSNGNIWVNSKFKLYVGIKVQEDIYWFAQGIFVPTSISLSRKQSDRSLTISAIDKFGYFTSDTNYTELNGTYKIPANTNMKKAVEDILALSTGATGNPQIDPKPPRIDSLFQTVSFPYDITKAPNSYFSDILIEIGNVFAGDIFYDTNGFLNVLKGNERQNMDNYSALWDYSDLMTEYFDPELEMDFSKIYNVVKVIGNNSETNVYTTILKNDLLTSPTRIQILGEKVKYIESNFCYNQARTDDFAKYLLRKYSMLQQSIKFQSSLIPHLDVNNPINIQDSYFKFDNKRFIIQSLTIPLSTGTLMDIEATDSSQIPYFEY